MKISLVVPVFNEEEAIPLFYQSVRQFKPFQHIDVEIVFVNDGSSDRTEEILSSLSNDDQNVKSINFSRNFGKEPALFAGLEAATGDAIIPIDVDLQDPIDVVPLLLNKWQDGADVVLAKRMDRQCDGRMKRKRQNGFIEYTIK